MLRENFMSYKVWYFSELDAGSINKKFTNLKWVTPEAQNKQKLVEEIKYLKEMENLLKTDVSNKIIYTHYSFFQ